MSWSAFVDESESNRKLDPDVYILAASIISADSCEAVRDAVRRFRLPGQRKVHWRDESEKRRRWLAEAVASLDALHLVVVRRGYVGEPSERRRRKTMERLLFELSAMGVHGMLMEGREAKQNRHDLSLVRALRARKEVPSGFRVDHAFGSEEPLLWLPDVVAGSVVAARCGDPCHLASLMPLVTICMIEA